MPADDLDTEPDDNPMDDVVDLPLEIVVYRTAVVLVGPGTVSLVMTIDAAERSAALLLEAAKRARNAGR
jgi:hypothetical protein